MTSELTPKTKNSMLKLVMNHEQPVLNPSFMLKTTQHLNELSPLIKYPN